MKKSFLIIITFCEILILLLNQIGCGPSWEERALKAQCDSEYAYESIYEKGKWWGGFCGISKDKGKRDCEQGKWAADRYARELKMGGFPSEKKYADCWCKGFLAGYDEVKKNN